MTTVSRSVYECDGCHQAIEDKLVSLRDYGLHFHPSCFAGLEASKILYLMEIDTMSVHDIDENGHQIGEALRVRNPLNLASNGYVNGKQEIWPGVNPG